MKFPDLGKRIKTVMVLLLLLTPFFYLRISVALPLLMILLGGMMVWEWISMAQKGMILHGNKENSKQRGALFWIGLSFLVVSMASFGWLYWFCGWRACFFVVIMACLMDTVAYFGGCILQGPKLCPSVSPHKTWSGAFAGLCIVPWLGVGLTHFLWSFSSISLLQSFGSCFLLCVAAIVGDLLESAAKRYYGVKDMGNIFPGHGGILDRMDSWLMTSLCGAVLCSFPVAKANPYRDWIDEEGMVRVEKRKLLEPLFHATGIRTGVQTRGQSKDITLSSWHVKDVTSVVQARWFLPGERWEMRNAFIPSLRSARAIIKICDPLLRLQKGLSLGTSGDGLLVMGCTAKRFYKTLKFVNSVLRKLDPKDRLPLQVYILCGPRPLQDEEKKYIRRKFIKQYGDEKKNKYSITKIIEGMKSEEDMVQFFARTYGSFRPVQYTVNPSPLIAYTNNIIRNQYHLVIGKEDPKRKRATTATTVLAWVEYMASLKRAIKDKTFVVVSSAPFIDYQWQVTQNIADEQKLGCNILAMGQAWKKPYDYDVTKGNVVRNASVGLDSLSRLFYELRKAWQIEHPLQSSSVPKNEKS